MMLTERVPNSSGHGNVQDYPLEIEFFRALSAFLDIMYARVICCPFAFIFTPTVPLLALTALQSSASEVI